MSDFKDKLNKSRGYEVYEEKQAEVDEKAKSYIHRLWLPPEKGTTIVFLDDDPPILEEHQLRIDGDWRHWYTCLKVVGENCPACDTNNKPYTVGFYTIIDMAEWTDNKGKKHANELKLLPAKLSTLRILKHLSQSHGSLAGCVFDVFRSSSDAANVGDLFEFKGKMTKEQILALNKDAKPYNYSEILDPLTPAEMSKNLKAVAVKTYESSGQRSEEITW